MRRALYGFLLLTALRLTGVASEEEFVPWQSVSIRSSDLPEIGVVVIDASTRDGSYQKIEVTAFGRIHVLTPADLKRLEGFPLSSVKLTHEAGYVQLGGHTVNLRFSRTYYDAAKKLVEDTVVVMVPKDAALTILEIKSP